MEAAAQGEFLSVDEVISRAKVSKSVMDLLRQAGARAICREQPDVLLLIPGLTARPFWCKLVCVSNGRHMIGPTEI